MNGRTPSKRESKQTHLRVLYARETLTRFLAVKGVVARDGIEPPTPAFSGPLTRRSGLKSTGITEDTEAYDTDDLG